MPKKLFFRCRPPKTDFRFSSAWSQTCASTTLPSGQTQRPTTQLQGRQEEEQTARHQRQTPLRSSICEGCLHLLTFVAHPPHNVASHHQKTSKHEHEQQHTNHKPPLALISATGIKLLASHHIRHGIKDKSKACPCSSALTSSLLHDAVVSLTDTHSSYQQADHDQTHYLTSETQHPLLHSHK